MHVDVVGAVDDAVEDRLGDDGVGEQRIPVGDGPVRGEDDRPVGCEAFADEFVAMSRVA